jgi:hypothetical protein
MQRIASEVRLWKEDDVRDVLLAALALVDEVAAPPELREQVFIQACGLLAQKNVQLEQMAMGVPAMHVPRG